MSFVSEAPEAFSTGHVLDLLGVGCGPANLALAALLAEEQPQVERLFLDARPEPAWHPGMLIEGSQLQITVLKDLVTVRNPQSRFSFLKYLQVKGRLFEFLNLRDLFPSRLEFNDYLGWAAEQLGRHLRYGKRVLLLEPGAVTPAGEIETVTAHVEDALTGESESYEARNLVVATGGTPWVPDGVELDSQGKVFHSNDYLQTLEEHYPDLSQPYRFVIVGRGQSAAEIFENLLHRYPNAQITGTLRGFGFKPVDESDFTNSIFFPEMVDFVYNLEGDHRKSVVDSFRDVNYAVVDAPLIRRIYKALYEEKVRGKNRARIHPYLVLKEARRQGGGAVASFEHRLSGGAVTLSADGVIVCTGYRRSTRLPILEPLVEHLKINTEGEYEVGRDYGVLRHPSFRPKIFLQGYCEKTHGISETVLSLVPIRAQDIWQSLESPLADSRSQPRAAFPAHSGAP